PLAFLSCGLLVRSIADQARRKVWAVVLAAALVLTLLFHVQVFAFVALAFLALLLTTRAPEDPHSVSSFGPGRAKSIHTSASARQVASEGPGAHGVEMPLATRAITFNSQRWREVLVVRVPALVAALPAAVLFAVWVVGRVGQPTEVEYGAPWKAWG